MESVESPPRAANEARTPLRCARCGVESAEPTCFVFPGPSGSPPDIRCITCEQRRLVPSTAYTVIVVLGSIVWPLLYLAAFQKSQFELGLPVLVFACLLYPIAIIAHELGHALTAYIVGLEVGAIGLGSGRVVSKFELLGLPIRLHMWPISGRVYLGAASLRWLRTRLWVATLMGPMTNALLLVATTTWRPSLVSVFGTAAVSLWFWVNFSLLINSLIPRRVRGLSRSSITDGLQLLTLPNRTREQLAVYRTSALSMRALSRFEDDNFSGARTLLTAALQREPENGLLQNLQAACYLSEGEYRAGLDIVKPLADRSTAETAQARALVYNTTAFATAMLKIGAAADDPQLLEADRLSGTAFGMFPCVLDYRLTRSLILAATERPLQTLQLLEYPLFHAARPRTQAQRAAVQAFAHRQLGNLAEAEAAAALAIRLDASTAGVLRTLGVTPSPTARAPSVAKPAKPSYVPLTVEHETVSGANLVLARLAGIVLLLFGLGLIGLIGLFFMRNSSSLGARLQDAVLLLLIFGVVGSFCCSVGYRLTFNRPASNGSILSRHAWVALAVVFTLLGLLTTALIFLARKGAGGAIPGAICSFAFAALCWKARQGHPRRKIC